MMINKVNINKNGSKTETITPLDQDQLVVPYIATSSAAHVGMYNGMTCSIC